MKKQEMIDAITMRLRSLGVFPQESTVTDIEIQEEFLDAEWSTGKKKIEYRALALLDEDQNTLYFWEFKKETSAGFSFGFKSEKSSQACATVYRHVKGIGYGPEGKAYEYDLDLGAITRIFKEIATNEGWKFRVVLSKRKASYDH